ncbi:MAG: S9 family peptidase [Ignavibacteriae bacterium]|nr:S9 family peptidase [Ignavibacteriota bacterium]
MKSRTVLSFLVLLALFTVTHAQTKRAMTYMDVIEMASVGSAAISPDGKWALYVKTTTDWKAAKRFSDVYLVSAERGISATRQMTYTKEKNETSPKWLPDGKSFVFLSNREAPESKSGQNQLYWMRPDGGEAQKITETKEGVGPFAFSKDGVWLAFSTGKDDEQQVWTLKVADFGKEKPKQLTKHSAGIESWQFSPDSKRIYFLAADSADKSSKDRKEKKFSVNIRNEDSPPVHLWAFDIADSTKTRLTSSPEYSVSSVQISDDSKWIGFRGTPSDRYQRTVTESNTYSDLYLLEVATGTIERLTDNKEIGESSLSFSPDSKLMAFSAANDFQYFRNSRVFVRPVTDKGGAWKELGDGFDGDIGVSFWSENGKTIYFNEGWRATNQLFALDVATGNVKQITNVTGVVSVQQDDDTKKLIVNYSDPSTPFNIYTVASVERISNKKNWTQLTDSNPQVAKLLLGETEAVQWKSADGTMVEGILVKPVGYEKGKRYPLIVQIHGGPAAASLLSFNAGYQYYSHIYAAAGYACLLPNYRGSSNYGEKFRMETSGDYYTRGFEDIMAGVDHLIAAGIVDGDKLGAMGWSAGGHYSNWILTHTDRFNAISSGAGTMNWISMYAQSDVQRNREFYFQGQPYDRFEHFWDVSPLKYIKNAKTPTMIHVVDGDPRVPRPQSDELHMALKKIGVPTEYFVYPGNTHGITKMRNQMVKMVSEFNWMEKWITGRQEWFSWDELLRTLKDEKGEKEKEVADK